MAGAMVALLATARPLDGQAGPRASLLAAAGLFVAAAITDALDGHLARKWKAVSIFGRIMDPLADKLLVLGAAIMLAGPAFALRSEAGQAMAAGFTGWMAVVILARELLVTSIRGAYEARGVDFSASAWGKAKMVVQSLAIPACLLAAGLWAGQRPAWVARGVELAAWATTIVTAASALPYVHRAWRAGGSLQARGHA
ncbi:MAG: hypothetical protein KatS3mg103_0525 [Phycisphaerales bacterium]|nr:MAG: hypothetical protein KatS3mg103_0525 [Phycisphaerales bacterium]